MKTILADTCFWFAYYGTRNDSMYAKAGEIYKWYFDNDSSILLPYPVLYETINTKLVRDKNFLAAQDFLKKIKNTDRYQKLADEKYRDTALNRIIIEQGNKQRRFSYVDSILRMILEDTSIKVNVFVTFNTGDFIDVCEKRGIRLIDEKYTK